MDEVEKLSVLMCNIYNKRNNMNDLACFILRREIEARLEEHNLICKICKRPAMYNSGGTYCDRLADLRRDLERLGEK